MSWYFNFHNERGFAFHEFSLPGRPASHTCIRLLHRDAEWLYSWGDGWTLSPDSREILQLGTPVFIIGAYEFSGKRPFLNPERWGDPIPLPRDLFAVSAGDRHDDYHGYRRVENGPLGKND